jgi:hypothetical protein
MAGWSLGTRRKSDAAELLVVQFQGVAHLLHLPVRHPRLGSKVPEEGLDLLPPQVPPRPPRMLGEEPPHPPQAARDRLLLRPGLA